MGTRKKGSELVFNLQWRNKPDSGGDKSNVIGMYDTPKTTSNFEMFKSYLLKNSGVAGNDVKVTYITDDGQEWIIDSQKWFEIALSAFRSKARFGEVIYLKLDKISDGKQQITRKLSNDVETQSDVDSMGNNAMTPPEWFINYMTQFKRDIVQEVTEVVSANLMSNTKDKEGGVPIVISTVKKIKPETSKRSKKHIILGETPIDKDLLKTIKFDRKLEIKLDKLDAKTKKIKEKKQALISKIENDDRFNKVALIPNEENACASTFTVIDKEPVQENLAENSPTSEIPIAANGTLLLNGRAQKSKNYERMMGGEIYLHTWEIINTGSITWPTNTELRLTWGSADLVPSEKCLSCPTLKPGLKGRIYVRFQIPAKPGTYETYWNFFSGSIRFGQALSCCIIVEEPLRTLPMNLNSKHNFATEFAKSPESSETETNIQSSLIDSEKYLRYLKKMGEEIKSQQKLASSNQQLNDKAFNCFPGFNSENSLNTVSSRVSEVAVQNAEEAGSAHGFKTEDQTSQNSFQLIYFPTKTEEKPESDNLKQVSPDDVFNLSQRVEDMKLEDMKPLVDSDSDWESVWSYGKNKQLEDFPDGSGKKSSNIYGIQEKDLIVDLSVNSKENAKIENNSIEEKENTNGNQDNNNNNGSLDNNNSTEVISEIASEASSDVSSGYDVLQVPICEEKEDESSGYVYITIDGNKLSVPKHILRPDFVANAEEAPGPDIVVAEKPASPKPEISETPKTEEVTESKPDIQEQNVQDNLSCMTHCSAVGSCYSDTATGRLFIFPQNHPGYEVFCNNSACTSITREEPIEPAQTYSWSKSSTQYSLSDLQNCNPTQLKNDPYGPLEQSRTTPCSDGHSTPVPQASVEQPLYHNVSSPPSHSGCPYAAYNQTSPPYPYPQYQHVPNYQQSVPKPADVSSPKSEATAPPHEQPRSPDHANQGVPVHILPENLVSGAVNVASSAINTARSVINMIVPPKSEPGRWVNGHWITENPESRRAKNLVILAEMGFWDPDLNATLLARYNDDINKVINELIQ